MKTQLPDSFLAAGKAALSSYVLAIRNAIEVFHDHAEGTNPIAASEIPTGIVAAKVPLFAVTSRKFSPNRLSATSSATLEIDQPTADPALSVSPAFTFATNVLITVKIQEFESVAGTPLTMKIVIDGVGGGLPFPFPFYVTNRFRGMTILQLESLTSGAHTIAVSWSASGASPEELVGERRLDCLFFAQ